MDCRTAAVILSVLLYLNLGECRVLRGVSGSVTVVAPPGQQTTIQTTQIKNGQTETTSQVVTGSAQLALGDGGASAGGTPAISPQPAKIPLQLVSKSPSSLDVKVVATTTKPLNAAGSPLPPAPPSSPVASPAPTVVVPAPSMSPAPSPTQPQAPPPAVNPQPPVAPVVPVAGTASVSVIPIQDRVIQTRSVALGQETAVGPGAAVAQSVGQPAVSGVSIGQSDIAG